MIPKSILTGGGWQRLISVRGTCPAYHGWKGEASNHNIAEGHEACRKRSVGKKLAEQWEAGSKVSRGKISLSERWWMGRRGISTLLGAIDEREGLVWLKRRAMKGCKNRIMRNLTLSGGGT